MCYVVSLSNCVHPSPPLPSPDPAYEGEVPNLDGGEGHSPHIIFGTNLDLTEDGDTNKATPTPSAGEEGEGSGDGGEEGSGDGGDREKGEEN